MFKKSLSFFSAIIIILGILNAFPITFSAREVNIANTGSYVDEQWQWNESGVKQERCTYRAWHETYDRLGISLPTTWGDGGSWAANARRDGFNVDKTPSANSIVCWSKSGGWGHVAYVTGVDDNYIYIREGGIDPSSSYPNYWFRDTSFSKSNQNRWNGFSLTSRVS